jgi:ElaB/YqjD/DUF883 family membrane-anchored ribosome-binding protein
MTAILAAAVPRLREALYSQLCKVAEELDEIVSSTGRALDDWSVPVARFDRTRAALDVLGWNERSPEHDMEIDLDEHRQVIVDALCDELDTEHYLMSEKGPAAKRQRQKARARARTIEAWAESVGLKLDE